MVPLPTAFETFKMNPTYFLLAFFFAGIGIALALGALLMRNKRLRASLGLAFGAMGLGVVAIMCGVIDAHARWADTEWVIGTNPDLTALDHATLRKTSTAESQHALRFGIATGGGPLLAGATLALLGLTRRRRPHFMSAGESM